MSIAWDAAAAPRGLVGTALARLTRLLEHLAWQSATVAAGVVAVFFVIQWAGEARRVADLSSRLWGFTQSVGQLSSQVNETAQLLQGTRKPNTPADISESD